MKLEDYRYIYSIAFKINSVWGFSSNFYLLINLYTLNSSPARCIRFFESAFVVLILYGINKKIINVFQ